MGITQLVQNYAVDEDGLPDGLPDSISICIPPSSVGCL